MGSNQPEKKRICIVTGLSGAGKSTALAAFEDTGFFAVDGLPASLAPEMAGMLDRPAMEHYCGMALGMDLRQSNFLEELRNALEKLTSFDLSLIFLEASDQELLRRYAFTRRPHPLEKQGLGLIQAITEERKSLQPLRNMADYIIDSSSFSIHDMRQAIHGKFRLRQDATHNMRINVLSFGFKYGIPQDADYVLDLRFLPNPFLVEELKPLTGEQHKVSEYIFSSPPGQKFWEKMLDFFNFILPQMEHDCRPRLTLAFGCTGGRHRSVAAACRMAEYLKKENYPVLLEHRNINDDVIKRKGFI